MTRTHLIPLTIAAIAATLGLAACGDDDDAASDSTVPEATEAAPDTTEAETPESADTTVPETTEPETTEPAATAPDTTESEATTPATSAPAECPEDLTAETAEPVLVGLDEADAEDAADECGWIVRVVRRDGEDRPVTLDFRPNRVNVEVTDGEVTAVVNIG